MLTRLRPVGLNALPLIALSGLAVAQPLLDLLGENPEFFVAAGSSTRDIVTVAFVLVLALPLAAVLTEAVARLIDARLGQVVHSVLVGLLAAVLGLGVARQLGITGRPGSMVLAVAVGAGVAVGEAQWAGFRQALRYLAIAPIGFLALFLFGSDTARLFRAEEAEAETGVVVSTRSPVVLVVLDEVPLADLVRPDGTLAPDRFSGFSRLAAQSTWYPEAISVSPNTVASVPAILTGLEPRSTEDLPISADHPRNLFTLLGRTHDPAVLETVTEMCPSSVCTSSIAATGGGAGASDSAPDAISGPEGSVWDTLADSAVVFGHVVLPDHYRRSLPAVDESWGDFLDPGVDTRRVPTGDSTLLVAPDERPSGFDDIPSGYRQLAFGEARNARLDPLAEGVGSRLEAAVGALRPTERSLVFLHDQFAPHWPWERAPSGASYADVAPPYDRAGVEGEDEAGIRLLQQRHLLQVSDADRVLSTLMDRLEAAGVWEEALVIVTADHGVSFEPGQPPRAPGPETRGELYPVPLFVKQPGQTEAMVDHRVASTVDVLPTIVDVLGVTVDWAFDGQSLVGAPRPAGAEKRVATPLVEMETIDVGLDDVARAAARNARRFPDLEPIADAVRTGSVWELVGGTVRSRSVVDSGMVWRLADAGRYRGVTPGVRVPIMVSGEVEADDAAPPPEVLVAVNGTVGGVAVPRSDGGTWRIESVVDERLFVRGANEIDLYVPRSGPGGPVLAKIERSR